MSGLPLREAYEVLSVHAVAAIIYRRVPDGAREELMDGAADLTEISARCQHTTNCGGFFVKVVRSLADSQSVTVSISN